MADKTGLDRAETITICICTYRRPSIGATLETVARQRLAPGHAVRVVVVDNDVEPSARALVEDYAARLSLDLTYVHAPAQNISIARNAAMDAATTRWMAFIDDDEVAEDNWLSELLSARRDHEVIVGQSAAVYLDGTPGWARRCDFHSNRIGGSAENAYTSNVMMDMDFVRRIGTRFRLDFGQTGGEDTFFFRELAEAGARFVYKPGSIVREDVTAARANMQWVRKRKYRSGQSHAHLLRAFDRKAYGRLVLTAGAKALFSAVVALVLAPVHWSWRKWFARSVFHCGAVSAVLGQSTLQEYAPAKVGNEAARSG